MATKGLTQAGELSAGFDKQMMKFLDAVWDGVRTKQMDEAQAKAFVAHVIAAMHYQGPEKVAGYFDTILQKPAATRWQI